MLTSVKVIELNYVISCIIRRLERTLEKRRALQRKNELPLESFWEGNKYLQVNMFSVVSIASSPVMEKETGVCRNKLSTQNFQRQNPEEVLGRFKPYLQNLI